MPIIKKGKEEEEEGNMYLEKFIFLATYNNQWSNIKFIILQSKKYNTHNNIHQPKFLSCFFILFSHDFKHIIVNINYLCPACYRGEFRTKKIRKKAGIAHSAVLYIYFLCKGDGQTQEYSIRKHCSLDSSTEKTLIKIKLLSKG